MAALPWDFSDSDSGVVGEAEGMGPVVFGAGFEDDDEVEAEEGDLAESFS